MSFLRRQESIFSIRSWTPAFAGVSILSAAMDLNLKLETSNLESGTQFRHNRKGIIPKPAGGLKR